MLQNYLKIALRNLARRRFYALVTLFGLTVGITFLLLIGSYIQGELAVNTTLRHVDRQYLLQSRWRVTDMGSEIGSLAPMGPALRQSYPNLVANYYRTYGVNAIVSSGEKHFREPMQVGDSTLLSMFGFPLAYGDPKTALSEPNTVVVTAALAQKYFQQTNVLRRQLTIQTPGAGKQVFTITGVLSNQPDNSVTHLFDQPEQLFISLRNFGYFSDAKGLNAWENRSIVTYLELQPGTSAEQLTQPFAQLLKTHAPPDIRGNLQPFLSPLRSFHLKADNELVGKMLLTLTVVALFILLMAVVNFVNITIGMSATRLREIGVRKVLGGLKQQVIAQFLVEAVLLTAGAALLALGCYELFRSTFATVLEKPIPSLLSWSPYAFLGLAVLVFVIGLLAGSYPAFVLSGLPSVDSLKGKLVASVQKGVGFRRALIVFQFTVAILVFVGAIVINRQVSFFFSKNLGYQKDQILAIKSVPRDWSTAGVQRMAGIRNQLARVPGVAGVSLSFEIPDGASSGSVSMVAQGQDSTQAITANSITTDEWYAQTYGLTLKAGRFFNADGGGYDSLSVVMNESATKALGWTRPEKALGQQVVFRGGTFRIRGVLTDFHFGSLRETIRPLVFIPVRKDPIYRYLSIKIAPGRQAGASLPETVAAIGNEWARLFPDAPFDYSFMDDTLQKLYKTEIQLQKASRLATSLALIIVFLGVLGLVSLNVTHRTKEIGIRKVLGSSTLGIVNLFMKEFVLILVIANVIAWPAAYYLLSDWLTRFAYRTDLSWWPFALVAFVLALLTGAVVSTQTIKAALANPVKSLRSE
ncbi:ABC transporter permease [Spirosoma fluviale]|uniref:Putative ABC transport system permease protein n=1 Tax=Spirosoma fluviale TaxID=1597977 RepID=A0A286G0V2_9BACT|nr:ABC transporter permease [Spirosoma fluviale]SOD89160.1 putative ABC transport system permease protein [Spirosoma fluviale]